ncbi:hypothetical protein AAFF_G00058450 [Aldrovandia affinis]|uniref:Uncharacterized protein n=1 Tax=Aldrovandia affinis TaxID=143900 RepID=A0AAD7WDZ5_9TELE|nr:hypothetical protein AAFF_G00058450 [Aldrovandia affinis]
MVVRIPGNLSQGAAGSLGSLKEGALSSSKVSLSLTVKSTPGSASGAAGRTRRRHLGRPLRTRDQRQMWDRSITQAPVEPAATVRTNTEFSDMRGGSGLPPLQYDLHSLRRQVARMSESSAIISPPSAASSVDSPVQRDQQSSSGTAAVPSDKCDARAISELAAVADLLQNGKRSS